MFAILFRVSMKDRIKSIKLSDELRRICRSQASKKERTHRRKVKCLTFFPGIGGSRDPDARRGVFGAMADRDDRTRKPHAAFGLHPLSAAAVILLGFVLPPLMVQSAKGKRLRKFEKQLGDALLLIANSFESRVFLPASDGEHKRRDAGSHRQGIHADGTRNQHGCRYGFCI